MAGMFIAVKGVSRDIPLGEIVFFRSFFAIIPLVIFLWVWREFPGGLATNRPSAHFIRASFGAFALFGFFAAIERLNLAEAVLIAQVSPIVIAIVAVVFLPERMSHGRIGALALGVAGVVVLVWSGLVWPELEAEGGDGVRLAGYIIGFGAAFLSAVALIMVRSLNATESPGAIALYFVIASMALALLTLPFGWVMPDGDTLVLLICTGLFGGFGHIAMTLAFRFAQASRLAPFEYLALLWPLLADVFLFDLALSKAFLFAAPLILAGAGVAAAEPKRR
jgi:drug/metabolite transporter (DMT)-like permease